MRGRSAIRALGLAGGLCCAALPNAVLADCTEPVPSARVTHRDGMLKVVNQTLHPVRMLWSDFEGKLTEYRLLQPGEESEQGTRDHHLWYVEILVPDAPVCAGPFAVSPPDICTITMTRAVLDGPGVTEEGCDLFY